MSYTIATLLFATLLVSVYSQNRYYRLDVILEYTGTVDWATNTAELKSTSETIQTFLTPDGYINYDVVSRLRGSISQLKATLPWVQPGKTFTSELTLSFGVSPSIPHVLHAETLGDGNVLPVIGDITPAIAVYNITSGEGAFLGVTGGITLLTYSSNTGNGTAILNAIFWTVPPPQPPPSEKVQ